MHSVFDTKQFILKKNQKKVYTINSDFITYLSEGHDGAVYRFYYENIIKLLFPSSPQLKDLEQKGTALSKLKGFSHYRFAEDIVFDLDHSCAGTKERYIENHKDEFLHCNCSNFHQNIEEIIEETKKLLQKGILPKDIGMHNLLYDGNKIHLIDWSRFLILPKKYRDEEYEEEIENNLEELINYLYFSILEAIICKQCHLAHSEVQMYLLDVLEEENDSLHQYVQKNFTNGTLLEFAQKEAEKVKK